MSTSAAARAFSHLALSVGDLDAMAAFYVDAFGFEQGPTYQSAGRRLAGMMECEASGFRGVFLRSGEFLLELLQYIDDSAPAQSPRRAAEHGLAHISFVVDDVDAAVAKVEKAGGQLRTRLDHRFVGPGQSVIVMCLDPEGNRIELISHPDAAEGDAHAAYLGLAELGWPARDVVDGSGL
jgi:glyoxylase I family protein